jgi:hypothetical protein
MENGLLQRVQEKQRRDKYDIRPFHPPAEFSTICQLQRELRRDLAKLRKAFKLHDLEKLFSLYRESPTAPPLNEI